MKNKKKGFTLIEVLVAMFIFTIGLLGLLPLLISNIKLNEEIKMRNGALKLLESYTLSLRGINYDDFNVNNLKNNMNYQDTFSSYFTNSLTNSPCPTGYEDRLYKEDNLTKTVGGTSVNYRYLIKLCIDEDYLYPYLKKVHIWIFWKFKEKFHKMETEIFIGKKT